MTAFRVDLDQLAAVVEQMGRVDAQLQQACAEVEAQIQQLHLTWTGSAAAAQQAAHQRWQDGAARMRAALAMMAQIASTAHGNYTNAAAANTQMWSL